MRRCIFSGLHYMQQLQSGRLCTTPSYRDEVVAFALEAIFQAPKYDSLQDHHDPATQKHYTPGCAPADALAHLRRWPRGLALPRCFQIKCRWRLQP